MATGLEIVASGVAVVQLATYVGKTVNKFRRLIKECRESRAEIEDFQSEASNFHFCLESLRSTISRIEKENRTVWLQPDVQNVFGAILRISQKRGTLLKEEYKHIKKYLRSIDDGPLFKKPKAYWEWHRNLRKKLKSRLLGLRADCLHLSLAIPTVVIHLMLTFINELQSQGKDIPKSVSDELKSLKTQVKVRERDSRMMIDRCKRMAAQDVHIHVSGDDLKNVLQVLQVARSIKNAARKEIRSIDRDAQESSPSTVSRNNSSSTNSRLGSSSITSRSNESATYSLFNSSSTWSQDNTPATSSREVDSSTASTDNGRRVQSHSHRSGLEAVFRGSFCETCGTTPCRKDAWRFHR